MMSLKREYSPEPGPSGRNFEISKKQRLDNNDNVSAIRSGKILTMRLINFMCYDNFFIKFHEHINFIIGNNGSGKSAILTALVIGLGSKAFNTDRGKNIKQLIKKDRDKSTIEICIANSGCDSYKKEIFGDIITIVREIRTSSSSYKIKNQFGKIIYENADNLHKILLHFNIQPDNPVVILTQDKARNFMRTFDPIKSYELSMRATQIDTIVEKINYCLMMLKQFKHVLILKIDQLEKQKKEIDEMEVKYKFHLNIEKEKEILENYRLELLWIDVIDQEKVVEATENKMKSFKDKIDKITKLTSYADRNEEDFNRTLQNLEQKLSDKESLIKNENQKVVDLSNKRDEIQLKLKKEEKDCEKLKEKIKFIEKQKELLENAINERRNSTRSEQDRILKLNLREQIEKLEREITIMESKDKETFEKIGNYERKFEELKTKRKEFISEERNLKIELENIEKAKEDRLLLYGTHMSRLLSLIENEYNNGRFSEKPIGPIGIYIEVSNEKWKGIVERILGNTLKSFIVNLKNDRKVLDEILRREFPGVNQSIVTTRFLQQVYNTENEMVNPPNECHLLINEIQCSNAVVMNYLIDRFQIERILLVEDQDLAVKITSENQYIPRNLLKVYLLNPTMEFLPLPLYRVYSLNIQHPRFLQVNLDLNKMQLNHEIDLKNNQKKFIEAELDKYIKKLQNLYVEQKFKRDRLVLNRNKMHNLMGQLEEMEISEYGNENEIQVLIDELQKNDENFQNHYKKFEEKQNICKEHEKALKEKEEEIQRVTIQLNIHKEESRSITVEYDRFKLKLHVIKGNQFNHQKQYDALKLKLADTERTYEREKFELEKHTKRAEKKGQRIETTREKHEIENMIKMIDRKINRHKDENIIEIKFLLRKKEIKYVKAKRRLIIIQNTLKEMYDAIKSRTYYIQKLKEHIALSISDSFKRILKVRGYFGDIRIDHVNRKIDISVVPRGNDVQNAVSNTRSLSGGERSFSTVAFLLSLWHCIDHPFYFLDEYDVFMDDINRETVTRLLLFEAGDKKDRQYAFLTPNDISFINKTSKNINILKINK